MDKEASRMFAVSPKLWEERRGCLGKKSGKASVEYAFCPGFGPRRRGDRGDMGWLKHGHGEKRAFTTDEFKNRLPFTANPRHPAILAVDLTISHGSLLSYR
jgi:hypothetical protein